MNNSFSHAPHASSGFDGPENLNHEVYSELRKIAARYMAALANGSTLQPTVLVHEAWLRMVDQREPWRDQRHFLSMAATTMRHILVDHARSKSRICNGGGRFRAENFSLSYLSAPIPDDEILLIDEGLRELEKVNPLRAKIVIERFFGGLTDREIADGLGIGERSVERHWAAAKVWLFRWMRGTAKCI